MGIPRPKRLPHAGVARSKPTSASVRKPHWMSKVVWQEVLDMMGPCVTVVPRILVYVNTRDRDAKRLVRAMLHNTEVKVQEEHDIGGGFQTALVITGSVDQLHSAVMHTCVLRWELVMSARVGFIAQGGGPEKIKAGPAKDRKAKWRGDPADEQKSLQAAIIDRNFLRTEMGV